MSTAFALYTIGYEGSSISDVVERLKEARIQIVVDVRELPLSRKPGFSKNSMSTTLRAAGIDYVHVRPLVCPKPIRARYKVDLNWRSYCRDFETHLQKQTAATLALAELSSKRRACLVCFERDFTRCHRSIVAERIAATASGQVAHLIPGKDGLGVPKRFAAAGTASLRSATDPETGVSYPLES